MNYPPYPYSQPCQYIPVPPGTDIERAIAILNRLEKRKEKRAAKEKAEKEKSKPKPPSFSFGQMVVFLMAFGWIVGIAQVAALEHFKIMLKGIVN